MLARKGDDEKYFLANATGIKTFICANANGERNGSVHSPCILHVNQEWLAIILCVKRKFTRNN